MAQELPAQAAEMRRFNRFYTQLIGVLDEGHLHSPFSLAQVRVLYELAQRDGQTASELCDRLALDAGYSSRMLRELQRRGLVNRRRSSDDGRRVQLQLTAKGTRLARELDRAAQDAIEGVLDRVTSSRRAAVIDAMRVIRAAFEPGAPSATPPASPPSAPAREPYRSRAHPPCDMGWPRPAHVPPRSRAHPPGDLGWPRPARVSPRSRAHRPGDMGSPRPPGRVPRRLRAHRPGDMGSPSPPARVPYRLRTHRPGDMGWIVHRHGVLYAEEYGWDERFEALVARITADFIANFDATRERCWIAERDGATVGAVFLVARSKTVAQLRLLYVEPAARGLGIGRRLVQECTRFAREAGYRKIMLWTNSVLASARKIYAAEGYRLVGEAPHSDFGVGLIGQTWELVLA